MLNIFIMMMKRRSYLYLGLLLGLLTLNACNSDDNNPTPQLATTFGVAGFSFAPDGNIGVLSIVESLDSGKTDLSASLVIPGGANFASDGNGNIFVGRVDAPSLTRYTLSEDGNLEEGPTVSFANSGIVSLGGFSEQFQFISDERAYFIDGVTSQVIVWNPTEMIFESAFSMGDFAVPAGQSAILGGAIRSGDRIIAYVRYVDSEGVTRSRTAVVFIDTQTNTATIDFSETCGGISGLVEATNGDVYFASNNISAVNFEFGLEGSFEPCWMKVLAGTNEIDDSFNLNPNSLTNSTLTATLVPGPGNSAYISAYDKSLLPINPSSTPREVQSSEAWRLWRINDLNDLTQATLLEDFPAGGGAFFTFSVNDNTYISNLKQDFSGGSLINVTDINNITGGLEVDFIPLAVFGVE